MENIQISGCGIHDYGEEDSLAHHLVMSKPAGAQHGKLGIPSGLEVRCMGSSTIRVPFLVPLHVRCRNITDNQQGPIILRRTHV